MSLNRLIINELRRIERFKSCKIWSVENHEKYSTLQSQTTKNQRNQQHIFQMMQNMNVQAMERPSICADSTGRSGFRATIDKLGQKLSMLSNNKQVHYIEIFFGTYQNLCTDKTFEY